MAEDNPHTTRHDTFLLQPQRSRQHQQVTVASDHYYTVDVLHNLWSDRSRLRSLIGNPGTSVPVSIIRFGVAGTLNSTKQTTCS